MGFLTDGGALPWEQAKKYADYIREHGIYQFLAIYQNTKTRKGDCLKFGDEIEYMVVHVDDAEKKIRLALRAHQILDELMKEEKENPTEAETLWRPEYANYMIEGTPGKPYGNCVTEYLKIEENMRLRRKRIQSYLNSNERLLCLTGFPLLGVGHFTEPPYEPRGPVALSLFTPDELIFPHARFRTLTQNIRERRGKKVEIRVPLYRDRNTQPLDDGDPKGGGYHIYMDSMAFGMGLCCLQCTFQAVDINEARYFYDQLAVLCPIMLALSAGCPIFRGHLADIDARWCVISASVDDRTTEELGEASLQNDRYVINKSRYDSVDCYISPVPPLETGFNDIDLVYDIDVYAKLMENGIDELLARHIAHLFIRDPLVIYEGKIELDDSKASDHFENIQSTNWQTVRFKPPPPASKIGWRTEFRPMELQISDFENAALVTFIVLLTRMIKSFDLDIRIPITKVDENMASAQKRAAVVEQTFYFRTHITQDCERSSLPHDHVIPELEENNNELYRKMTINEIMNGSETFVGLIPLVEEYLSTQNIDIETRMHLDKYVTLIKKRASGELMTPATWIRHFVQSHPAYNSDSIITDEINYDLLKTCMQATNGEIVIPELLGDLIAPSDQSS
ncbi:glutamate--cysteine ligase [Balamuthia mandrillaris]